MNQDLNELDRLAATDPAADVQPDPHGPTALALRDRVITGDHQRGVDPAPGARSVRVTRRRLVTVLAIVSLGTGAVAVADRAPFGTVDDACAPVDGRDTPLPECGDLRIDTVIERVEREGTDFEQQVLADGKVDRAEYDAAAERAVACMQAGYDQVAGGFNVEADIHTTEWGPMYGWTVTYPDHVSANEVPWEQDAPEGQAVELTDEVVQQDPLLRCEAEHMADIHSVWQDQKIANQPH